MKITEKTKIEDCELSIYLKRLLKNAKIETVSDLLKEDRNLLIKYRGVGKASYNEIINFINNLEFNS